MFDTPLRREKEAVAMAQREANAQAAARGEALPYPNPWDVIDPTKVPADATPEQIQARYRAFRLICRAPVTRHTI